MRSTIRCGVCSTWLTLIVPLDSAGGGLGRDRVVSRRWVLFWCFYQNTEAFVRTYRYIVSTSVYVYKKHSGVAGRSLSVQPEGQWFESRMALFVCVPISLYFLDGAKCSVTNVKMCTMMIEVWSEQSRSQFYIIHTECCCCCCCCSVCCYTAFVAAAAVLLIPAAVRHCVPDGQIWCWFIESDPVFSFSSFKRDCFSMYPLAVLSCRIYGLDLRKSSVIAGMREAKAGVSPLRRSSP